jgi:hypothetical protein
VVYMLRLYTLVTAMVFGLAGFVLLALVAWNQAKVYAKARKAMKRTLSAAPRGCPAISRAVSQPQNTDRSRAA